MADRIKGITIEIGGDTTGLNKALKGTNSEIKTTQSQLKDVERLLKLDPKNTELLAQKQKLLSDAIKETNGKLETLKTAEKQAQDQFKQGKITQEQYDALKREIAATEQQLKSLEDQASKSNSTLQKIGEFGSKAESAGKKLLPVTAAVAGIGTASVAAAMELDDGYDTIITKTGATGQALEELNQVADNVFANLPTTMQNAGTAVGEINTRFGATGDVLEGLTEDFIKFAEINGTDLNNSIGQVDKIMEQWNIDMSETGNVLGLITKKGQDTGISVDTLMGSVQQNGATFKEMGLNMAQSIDLMAQFEANGVNADTAIAGLRKSIKAYTDEGKSTDEALRLTIDGIKNAKTETEALAMAQEVFGTKGAAEMSNAIREGRIDLDSLSSSMSDYGTVVEDTFNATLDPWDDAKIAMNNLKLAGADLGSSLLTTLQPIITKIVDGVKDFTSWFKNLDDGTKQMIITIAGIVAAVGPVLIFIGKLATGISAITSVLEPLKTVFSQVNTVMAANPIILIVGLIAALVAAFIYLWNNCEEFRQFWIDLWEKIKQVFSDAWDGIVKFFTETVPKWLAKLYLDFKEMPGKIWDELVRVVAKIILWGNEMKAKAKEKVSAVISTVRDFFAELPGKIKDELGKAATNVYLWATELKTKMKNWGKDMISGFIDGIKSMISKVVDTVKDIGNKIKSFLHFSRPDEGPLRDYETWMPDFMEGMAHGIKDNRYKVLDQVKQLAEGMKINVNGNYQAAVAAGGSTGDTVIYLENYNKFGTKEFKEVTKHVIKNVTSGQTNRARAKGVDI